MITAARILCGVVFAVALGGAAAAETVGRETNLPLPRFVSLGSGEANLRAGPGKAYPVEWVFKRRGLPLEVIAEFDVWRKVRDWEGTVGWMHESMLSGKRTARIVGENRALRREPDNGAAVVAELAPGVIGALVECAGEWCRLDVGDSQGWLRRDEFWGVYPEEEVE